MVRLDVAYEETYTISPEVNVDVIDETQVPDLVICKPFSFKASEDAKHLVEPPLGVIEIRSPNQLQDDKLGIKLDLGIIFKE